MVHRGRPKKTNNSVSADPIFLLDICGRRHRRRFVGAPQAIDADRDHDDDKVHRDAVLLNPPASLRSPVQLITGIISILDKLFERGDIIGLICQHIVRRFAKRPTMPSTTTT